MNPTKAADSAVDLSALLAPRSVALVGASERQGNLGGAAARMLRRFDFDGDVTVVHPSGQTVEGYRCYADLASLPDVPDVAILAIPALGIVDAVQQCGERGIRNAIAWAGGFAEGGAQGHVRQQALIDACRRYGIRLCGPNCLGIINTHTRFTGTFTTSLLDMDVLNPGSIAMVSQSGGLSTVSLALAQRAGFGFRYVISCGNEAILSVADFARALVHDAETRVVAMYIEAITDGAAFLDSLRELRQAGKPVIILKGGASEASGRAALAHTGRLAGSDRAFDAVMREAGAIRVHSIEEMLDVALLASTLGGKLPRGRNVAITTFGGGAGVLAVDQAERSGLCTPLPSESTAQWLAERLPPIAAIGNPVDLTPQSVNDARYLAQLPEALGVLTRDDGYDAVLFLSSAMRNREREVIGTVEQLQANGSVPVVVSWPLASPSALEGLRAIGVYAFPENARAARAIGKLVRGEGSMAAPALAVRGGASAVPAAARIDWSHWAPSGTQPRVISEHEVAAMLREAGLPVAAGMLVRHPDDLIEAEQNVPFPWAVKGISETVTHRADAGLLALRVASVDEAREVLAHHRDIAAGLGVTLDGCYVQQMMKPGHELLFSAFSDAAFGVMVACAAGGGLTELIDDTVVASAPLSLAQARDAIAGLRLMRKHATALSTDALDHAAEYLAAFSRVAATIPWPSFTLELNPVICSDSGAVAVDGLLVIGQ